MYHRQQNTCYPQKFSLAHFEATLSFSRSFLLAHNNKSQICYCGQISLQSAAVNCSFCDNLIPLGGNVYFAGDGTCKIILRNNKHFGNFNPFVPSVLNRVRLTKISILI